MDERVRLRLEVPPKGDAGLQLVNPFKEHAPGKNPFQPGVDLWCSGFVPVYQGDSEGRRWLLFAGDGKGGAKIVWEGEVR